MILTNFLTSNVDVKLGDRIAQIMFFRPEQVYFKEVKDFIPNQFLTEDEFAALFATKLDKYTGN